jgi:4-cresol dehydrogenase (hydroxylating) flavoprotein subunit
MATASPGVVDGRTLTRALDAFTSALGRDNVLIEEEQVQQFRDPFWVKGSDEYDPAAAVMPASVAEVQAVVRIANEHKIPLWTVSTGRNYGYGGASPRVQGSVLVNLSRMNRVLEINEELAYAVVEPGVRWFDLCAALEEAGGALWSSIPDLGWGSVVGNSLEYGRGHTRFGSHASNICGMEVVLPTGDLLRTGMGAMTNSKSWHAYPHAFGPSIDGMFMQSSLGIVTRIGWRLMPRPETYISCRLRIDGDAALVPVIDAMRRLMLDGTVSNYPFLGRGVVADENGQPDLDPASEAWAMRFAIYGHQEVAAAQYRIVEKVLGSLPGVELSRSTFRGDDRQGPDTNHEDRVQAGIPGMELLDLYKIPYGPDTGHLDLSPVGPLTGQEVLDTVKLVRSLYDRVGQPYAAGLLLLPRSVIHASVTFYDPNDEAKTREVYANYAPMVAELAKVGYPLYRTNIQNMDVAASVFDFNDHALRRFHETIKDALDPNGILQPGKQGVWPKALRERAQGR